MRGGTLLECYEDAAVGFQLLCHQTACWQVQYYRSIVRMILLVLKFRAASHCVHDWKALVAVCCDI